MSFRKNFLQPVRFYNAQGQNILLPSTSKFVFEGYIGVTSFRNEEIGIMASIELSGKV